MVAVLEDASATYSEWAPSWRRSNPLAEREREQIPERLAQPGWWGRVAECAGEAVGYVIVGPAALPDNPAEPIPGLLHVWHLFVRPRWWGSGVASGLLGEALAEAAMRGYEAARLYTPRENARARAFYRREGWRETGVETYAPDLDLELVEFRRSCA